MIQVKSSPDHASTGLPVGSAFVKQAELWAGAQRDLLVGIETLMTGWAQRQRQAFEASSRSIQKMCESRDILDLMQAQHDWVSDCMQWTVAQVRALGNDTAVMTRKAAERLGEGGDQVQRGNPPPDAARSVQMERAAAE